MFQRLKNIPYQQYFHELKDIRVIGLMVFGGIVLLVTWSGIGVIQTNYDLQKKIASLEQSVSLKQLENSNLKLRNEYFETDHYLELQARRQFSRAAPGETLILVPKTVALKRSSPVLTEEEAKTETLSTEKPSYQQHFEAWVDFLFRRKPLDG